MVKTIGVIFVVVIILALAIGLSAWWKARLVGQGKILQRASNFMEYAEIFTIRPITNEQYAAAIKMLDLSNTGTSLSGDTKTVNFSGYYFSACIQCVERTATSSVYRFSFTSWKSNYGRASMENEMNMLLTRVEKMFLQLDPNAQVSTIKNEVTKKRSII